MQNRLLGSLLILLLSATAWGQGEDSQPYERDLQVIATMISGGFDNANQNYFDGRGSRDLRHRRIHVDINPVMAPEIGKRVFSVTGYWDNEKHNAVDPQLWTFTADADAGAVRLQVWLLDEAIEVDANITLATVAGKSSCDLYWQRDAAQFHGAGDDCGNGLPEAVTLSEKQMWLTLGDAKANEYQLHRVRQFECYADVPGVGGGRDEPYERYEGFHIHDQGDAVWFDTKDNRRLGISLFLVDWPINNQEGIFTRDSFVIYVSEKIEGESKEHGYAFTVPDADRIGINLKWVLASCFMNSNKFVTPTM